MFDIVILTDSRYVNPKKKDWYIQQVLKEDSLLQESLERKGLKVKKKSWDDPYFNWSHTKHAIFRSTWDYFDRFKEFFTWIEKIKEKTILINSQEIIKWNIDKNYLKDLSNKGIHIAKTYFIEKKNKKSLFDLFQKTKWNQAIIKPAISGAARNTYLLNENNYTDFEDIFQELVSQECMLFQEFLHNIIDFGEISLIMIQGENTHAVKKIAKKGDFRVQDDHGGTVESYTPKNNEISFAKECINACPYSPIYARVDMIYDNNNNLSLSELELIEPELWFRKNNKSAEKLAEAIYNIL